MKEKLIDSPITDYSEDLLNRKIFVDTLASSLQNWDKEESLVIGLYGKWGSGKSSIINLVEKKLAEDKKELTKEEQKNAPIVVRFNPWGFSESDDLFEPFIMQLKKTLKGPEKIQNLGNKLEALLSQTKNMPSKQDWLSFGASVTMLLSFFGISIPLVVPEVTEWFQSASKWFSQLVIVIYLILQVINCIISGIKNWRNKKSLSDIKKDIATILKKKKRKIVIIIDDIDRLSSKEIKQLFRIIRSNADFPHTIYLLSFDREIVEKSLDVQNQINGHDYLEKIINIEYDLPKNSDFEINEYLFHELNEIVDEFGEEGKAFFTQESIKWNSLKPFYPSILTTIRDVKRYINSLYFKLNQYKRNEHLEINLLDYFIIELIRLKFPYSYNVVMQNKNVFVLTKKDIQERNFDKKSKYESLLSQYSEGVEKQIVSQLLPVLFPVIEQKNGDLLAKAESDLFRDEEKYCSISTEKYFDIYFKGASGISQREVLHSDYLEVQNNINDYNRLMEIFRQFAKEKRFSSFVFQLHRSGFLDIFCSSYNCVFFSALFDAFEELPRDYNFSLTSVEEEIIFMFYKACNPPQREDGFKLLQNIIGGSKSIYMPIKILNNFSYSSGDKPVDFTTDQIESLSGSIIDKIEQHQDRLIGNPYFIEIIRFWKNSGFRSFNNYFEKNIDDDSFFLSFIKHFVYEVLLPNGLFSLKSYATDIKRMEEFYSSSKAIKRIEKIKKESIEDYNTNREIIDHFSAAYYRHLFG